VTFSLGPNLIARMEDHDLWMAFFPDPDGNSLALIQEAPHGYSPVADRPSTESSLASDAGTTC
jgi:hypothetical protein